MKDLFGREISIEAAARIVKRKDPTPNGYAAWPSTGPMGETCKSCRHIVRNIGNTKVYLKCGLNRACWTRGRRTDILAGAPSCEKWEAEPPCSP